MFHRTAVVLVFLLAGGIAPLGAAAAAEPKIAPAARPRVLILGDSISIGYTAPVRQNLMEEADVLRPNANCQHTAYGLKQIKTWLGSEKWDVIHFNWGIWDTHMLDENNNLVRDEANAKSKLHIRHTPDEYRKNLTELVEILEGTGAKLIWASTTPFMSRKGDRFEDIPKLNRVAEEIMRARGIAINDLYTAVLPQVKQWQSGDKVHFTAPGNVELGKLVSASIRQALRGKPAEVKPTGK